jgi:hypothetical protein
MRSSYFTFNVLIGAEILLSVPVFSLCTVYVSPNKSKSVTSYILFLLYYLVCEAIGTAATPGLLRQPRVIVKMIVEKKMECRLVRKTEVLGENLLQRHLCPSQNPT